jgi:hypothetical protein
VIGFILLLQRLAPCGQHLLEAGEADRPRRGLPRVNTPRVLRPSSARRPCGQRALPAPPQRSNSCRPRAWRSCARSCSSASTMDSGVAAIDAVTRSAAAILRARRHE